MGSGVDRASRYFEEGQVGIVALALKGGGGQVSRGRNEQGEVAARRNDRGDTSNSVTGDLCSNRASSPQGPELKRDPASAVAPKATANLQTNLRCAPGEQADSAAPTKLEARDIV